MKIAVAIPVKDQSDLFHWALRSLRAQDADFSIGVADATPDDSVQSVIRQFPDLPFCYNRHGPDRGQAVAIQEAWDHLEGDILCWLNADDYLFPGVFQHVIEIFQSNPEVSVVYGDAIFTDRDGGFTGYFPAVSDNPSDLRRVCCISQPACFATRGAVNAVGGLKADLQFTMDWDLWTRLLTAGMQFFYTRRPLAAVRMYEGTKTSSRSPLRTQEILRHVQIYAGSCAVLKTHLLLSANWPNTPRSFSAQFLGPVINSYARTKQSWRRYFLGNPVNTLYGFEPGTNLIHDSAQVFLPYYKDATAKSLEITGKWRNPPMVSVDGKLMECTETMKDAGLCGLECYLHQARRDDELYSIGLVLASPSKAAIASIKLTNDSS